MTNSSTAAVLYTRVSTDEQAGRGFSLRDQLARLEAYCARQGIEVLRHFREDHSAKTFDRPAWKALMRYVRANRSGVGQILFVKWDRFSRNATDALQMIRQLDALGVTAQAIDQPIDRSVPEQLMMLAIYVAAPQVENQRRSLATIRGMRRANREGRWTTTAPKGYLRVPGPDGKSRLVPDPDQAEHVREAFHLAATTDLPAEAIRRRLVKRGFRCSRSQFLLLLKNPVYPGKIAIKPWRDEPEEIARGLHEALVCEALFWRVQEKRFSATSPRTRRRRILRPQLVLRGHLLCPSCRGLMTGSGSTGNGGQYFYYHCHRCGGARFRADQANAQFPDFLCEIQLSKPVARLWARIAEDVATGVHARHKAEAVKARRNVGRLEERLLRTDRMYVEGELERDSYQRLKTTYASELRRAKARAGAAAEAKDNAIEAFGYATQLFSNLGLAWEEADLEGRDALLGSIFPGKLLFENGRFRTAAEDPLIALFGAQRAKKEDADLSKEAGVLSGSPGRIRTYNPAVNSRMLCH